MTWRAITLHQPWATLIALGYKTIETRSWSTRYRGPLLIHAAKSPPPVRSVPGFGIYRQIARHEGARCVEYRMLRASDGQWIELPLGAVVAAGRLEACAPMVADAPEPPRDGEWRIDIDSDCGLYLLRPCDDGKGCEFAPNHEADMIEWQMSYGAYEAGRFGWLLSDCRATPVVPARGKQGLWKPTPELVEAATAA